MRRLSESTDLTSNCVLLLLIKKDLPEQPKHHILISGFGKAILIIFERGRVVLISEKRDIQSQRPNHTNICVQGVKRSYASDQLNHNGYANTDPQEIGVDEIGVDEISVATRGG